jgi:hypothetical protein
MTIEQLDECLQLVRRRAIDAISEGKSVHCIDEAGIVYVNTEPIKQVKSNGTFRITFDIGKFHTEK